MVETDSIAHLFRGAVQALRSGRAEIVHGAVAMVVRITDETARIPREEIFILRAEGTLWRMEREHLPAGAGFDSFPLLALDLYRQITGMAPSAWRNVGYLSLAS